MWIKSMHRFSPLFIRSIPATFFYLQLLRNRYQLSLFSTTNTFNALSKTTPAKVSIDIHLSCVSHKSILTEIQKQSKERESIHQQRTRFVRIAAKFNFNGNVKIRLTPKIELMRMVTISISLIHM